MTRHLGPHALAIHARPWFLHVQVHSCRCCPVSRTPYPGTFPVRLGGQVRVLPSCGRVAEWVCRYGDQGNKYLV